MSQEQLSSEKLVLEEEVFKENVNRQQENEIFIEYDPEKATEKLLNIQSLPTAEKLQYTHHLTELLEIIGPDITGRIPEIVKNISLDNDEEIKKAVLQQIPSILEYLQLYEDSYEIIQKIIQHTILVMLDHPSLNIKQEAGKRLSEAGQILNEQDRGNIILTKILNMAHDEEQKENRTVAVGLFSTLAQCFGKDLCEQFVGFEFLSLGEDPEITVRRESIINLPNISKVVSSKFFVTRILPFFIDKKREHIWGMRRACVEVIVPLALIAERPQRENELTQMLLEYLADQNRWVKVEAYKQLGPFIVANQGGVLNEDLFKHYIQMSEHQINYLSNDNEILAICAQYFPAVLTVYGPSRWGQLSKIMGNLIKSKHKKVRKPIACALHEIAKIIGQERAEKDLFHIYEKGLQKDAHEDVKLAAIKNYSEFLKVFDKEKRENLLEVLVTVQGEQHKWRIREMIAQQIDKLTEIYQQETIFQYIMPITMKLCNDIVSRVRQIAAQKAYYLVKALEKPDTYLDCVVGYINGFCLSSRFNQRQTFVFMCFNLMQDEKLFRQHFLQSFEQLTDDKVINVRIAQAECMRHQYTNKNPIINSDFFKRIEAKMRNDVCNDVKKIFQEMDDALKEEITKGEQKQKKLLKIKKVESPTKKNIQQEENLAKEILTTESNNQPITIPTQEQTIIQEQENVKENQNSLTEIPEQNKQIDEKIDLEVEQNHQENQNEKLQEKLPSQDDTLQTEKVEQDLIEKKDQILIEEKKEESNKQQIQQIEEDYKIEEGISQENLIQEQNSTEQENLVKGEENQKILNSENQILNQENLQNEQKSAEDQQPSN